MRRCACVALLLLAPACGGGPVTSSGVCGPDRACAKGTMCVVGRCRAPDVLPSAADASRLVLQPADVAVLSSAGGAADPWSAPISLGRASDGSVVVLLRWQATFREGAEISSAFVVLDPAQAAPPPTAPVRVDVARVVEPWSSSDATWGRQPRLDVPDLGAVALARGGAAVRIDVTEIVRRWSQRMPDEHGIALLASGDDPFGITCASPASGHGPRLEVYLR